MKYQIGQPFEQEVPQQKAMAPLDYPIPNEAQNFMELGKLFTIAGRLAQQRRQEEND